MIGKNTIKLIKSLSDKKNRIDENLFVAEGDKIVSEVLDSGYVIDKLIATAEFIDRNKSLSAKSRLTIEATNDEIRKASLLKNPQNCIAICELPEPKEIPSKIDEQLSLFLDDVQDPGNLGTIIRICDWFGIEQIFCSPGCADFYNPKVIQASMGSFCRIQTFTSSFEKVATLANENDISICGAFLDGENIYNSNLSQKTLLVLGNEGNGINKIIAENIDKKISIPQFNTKGKGAESLNVAIATAVICAEFRRQQNYSK